MGLLEITRDVLSGRSQRAFAHGTEVVVDGARDSGRRLLSGLLHALLARVLRPGLGRHAAGRSSETHSRPAPILVRQG